MRLAQAVAEVAEVCSLNSRACVYTDSHREALDMVEE